MQGRRPTSGILGRSDLVYALGTGQPEILQAVVRQLGLQRTAPAVPTPIEPVGTGVTVHPTPPDPEPIDSSGYPSQIQDIGLWIVTHYTRHGEAAEPQPTGPSYHKWHVEAEALAQNVRQQPLALWSDVGPRVRRGLANVAQSRSPDIEKLVPRLARREIITTIPRRRKRRWGMAVDVIRDFSLRLSPFQADQDAIIQRLKTMLPPHGLKLIVGRSPFELMHGDADLPAGADEEYRLPAAGTQVLVLGDLGCLSRSRRLISAWLRWGRLARDNDCRLLALVPCGMDQIPQPLRDIYSVQTWQPNRDAVRGMDRRRELVRQLQVLASPALRVEPGLLRDLRRLLPDATDASLEAEFWSSSLLVSDHPVAATLDPKAANGSLRPEFERLPAGLRRDALQCLRRWRLNLHDCPEIWFEEFLSLSDESRRLIPEHEQDLIDARASVRELVRLRDSNQADASRAAAWLHRSTDRLTAAALTDDDVGQILRKVKRELHDPVWRRLPPGTPPKVAAVTYEFEFTDRQISIRPAPTTRAQVPARPRLQCSDGCIQVFSSTGGRQLTADEFWKAGKPDFVSDFGTDKYGAWFDFQVPRHNGNGQVTQRMRWIPAGSFMMGSPKEEPGRDDDETQHRVTLSRGFWLADTACTQELWRAVTGRNPSFFKGEQRPVEQVSFEDVQLFLTKLSETVPGLLPALPTEAQWEFACRAGSTTPFSFGENVTTDQVNYDGKPPNLGSRKNKASGETVECKSLPANPWGLFEMHGNVYEWCQDWHRRYTASPRTNPVVRKPGSHRIVRGGGWNRSSRRVRSASRRWFVPGFRFNVLGFRLLSSASAEPTEEAEVPVAEQGSQPTRFGGADEVFRPQSVLVDDSDPVGIEIHGANQVRIRSNLEEVHVQRLTKPGWAVEFGRDPFGTYADFEVSSKQSDDKVRQRLRWIPPGSFEMGSPDDEDERYDTEVRHAVTISQGFWMFETPCTQALWLAVMGGKNPSRFQDALRPVEQVSWDEAVTFAEKLSQTVKALPFELSLPTEAQWEYACRAGTATAIYSGPLKIQGDANAPALDPIAWYGGNCGHKFDLEAERAVEVTWLEDKQYDFKFGGTRRVRQKAPNPSGLYDMLGNVWEWCHDWYGDYSSEAQIDPTGPEAGSYRVVRGGSWVSDARSVRSAYRSGFDPGNRSSGLGFRLLSSASQVRQTGAERVSGSEAQPRDEAAQKQRTK